MRYRPSCAMLFAGVVVLAVIGPATRADAALILTFGQTSGSNTITVANPAAGMTTFSGTDVAVSISQIDAPLATPLAAFFNFSASNTSAATVVGGFLVQNYSGTFTITTLAGGGGTNLLSGTFTDAVFGATGGTGLTLTSAEPPDTASFTSDVITGLGLPRSINLSFANSSPSPIGTVGAGPTLTLAATTLSVSGNFNAAVVPEPTTLAAAFTALPLIGGLYLRRRMKRTV